MNKLIDEIAPYIAGCAVSVGIVGAMVGLTAQQSVIAFLLMILSCGIGYLYR